MRLASCGFRSAGLPFWRELFKTIELRRFGQARILFPASFDLPIAERLKSRRQHQFRNSFAQRKIFQRSQPAQQAPEPLRLARRRLPGSCNGLFSVGFPTAAQDCAWPYEPASHSLGWQTLMDRREAPLLISNFLRVAQTTLACKPLRYPSAPAGRLRFVQLATCFLSIAAGAHASKSTGCGKPHPSVGKPTCGTRNAFSAGWIAY